MRAQPSRMSALAGVRQTERARERLLSVPRRLNRDIPGLPKERRSAREAKGSREKRHKRFLLPPNTRLCEAPRMHRGIRAASQAKMYRIPGGPPPSASKYFEKLIERRCEGD